MSSNKLFLTYLIIFALILALIISIVVSNENKRMTDDINNINAKEIDNKSNNEIIGSNNNIINKIEYTKVNLLNTNNIEVNQFQFSEIGVLQINQNPMLHFIISKFYTADKRCRRNSLKFQTFSSANPIAIIQIYASVLGIISIPMAGLVFAQIVTGR